MFLAREICTPKVLITCLQWRTTYLKLFVCLWMRLIFYIFNIKLLIFTSIILELQTALFFWNLNQNLMVSISWFISFIYIMSGFRSTPLSIDILKKSLLTNNYLYSFLLYLLVLLLHSTSPLFSYFSFIVLY